MTLSLCSAIPFLSILFAPQVFAAGEAASRTSGGTIYFHGQIVESPCNTATDGRQQALEVHCYQRGETSVETWPLASLTGAGVRSSQASMGIRYLDPQRKLAILTVSYE